MEKLAAALMAGTAHKVQPTFEPPTQTAETTQNKCHRPPQQPRRTLRRRQHRYHRSVTSEDVDGDDGEGDGDEPDTLVPDPVVCAEFSISSMTLWRWDRDPKLVALGLPPPITIRRRKFRSRRLLENFKTALMQIAIVRRAETA
jgi:hypothetical protein